jgi:hypothetical protein
LLELMKPVASTLEFGSDGAASAKGKLYPADPGGVPVPGRAAQAYALKLGAGDYVVELAGVGDFQVVVFNSAGQTVASQSGLANPRESLGVVVRSTREDDYWIVVSPFLGPARSERPFTLRVRKQ